MKLSMYKLTHKLNKVRRTLCTVCEWAAGVYAFWLFVMVQSWNTGVCWIDQVFVTELFVLILFFVHAAVLGIKTAFNLVKIHLLFRIIPLIQWSVMFCRPCFNRFCVWPHDVESFQGSTFCLFVMVQPWNIGVCWIDQVFVTELIVVIFFLFMQPFWVLKTAFNLVKIHLLFRIIPLI
jgi:hypothetical protein